MRTSEINRVTAETDITLTLELEGRGASDIDTGVGFLDHMLTLFAKHGRFDLKITAKGDNYVDDHHTVEVIRRYDDCIVPMDEALSMSAVDISGRPYLGYGLEIPAEKVGTFDTELTEEFWLGFVRNSCMTLHIKQLAGKNSHHIIEGTFKSVARTLRQAVSVDREFAGEIPSTKGLL